MSELDDWRKERAFFTRYSTDVEYWVAETWVHQQAKIDALTECIEEMSKDPAPEHPYHESLRCGVEDRDIQCRYEAAEYGWEQAFEYIGSIAVNYIPAPPQEQE